MILSLPDSLSFLPYSPLINRPHPCQLVCPSRSLPGSCVYLCPYSCLCFRLCHSRWAFRLHCRHFLHILVWRSVSSSNQSPIRIFGSHRSHRLNSCLFVRTITMYHIRPYFRPSRSGCLCVFFFLCSSPIPRPSLWEGNKNHENLYQSGFFYASSHLCNAVEETTLPFAGGEFCGTLAHRMKRGWTTGLEAV